MGLHYLLPLPGAGPMRLMAAGAAVVGRDDLRRWVETIYTRVYDRPPGDPRIAQMFHGLPEAV